MKKMLAAILSLILALAPAAAVLAENTEVTGELVIYSSMYRYVLDALDEALKAEFPNLTPGNDGSFFVYGGSAALINRIYGEMADGKLQCDMMLVAEPSLSLELKDAGYLEAVSVPDASDLLRFPYDPQGYWYPVRVCNMVLAVNPDLAEEWAAKGVSVPKTFEAFASDRSLKGLIAMGDPQTSGTSFAAVASLIQANHYGRQYLRGLAANNVAVLSGSETIRQLQEGEICAAMILEESVLKAIKDAEDKGEDAHLACVYPEDGVILIPSTVTTVAAEHSLHGNTDACKAVEKWFLTEEAQQKIIEGYMHSVFRNTKSIPYGSVDTNWLIEHDLGVKWENAYLSREDINLAWMEIVVNRSSSSGR